MTYNIINAGKSIEQVRSIIIRGRRCSNPADDKVIAAGLGYLYQPATAPECTETQTLSHEYVIQDGIITDAWTIVNTPVEEVDNA